MGSMDAFRAWSEINITLYDPVTMEQRYERCLTQYDQEYGSREEWQLRFQIYTSNVQFIDSINLQDLPFQLTDNQFTDLTNEEFRSAYMGFRIEEIVDEARSDQGEGLDEEVSSKHEEPSDGNSSTSSDDNVEYNSNLEIFDDDDYRLEPIEFLKKGITEIVHIKHHFLIPIGSFTHSLSNPKIEPPKSVAASRRPASLPASRVSGIVSRLRHCLRLQNYD
ncbi:hypothetical protein LWI29_013635 [Acer saccharum]|uniref:Cathepsin propeptide inhibitor domain-containing protein n=1 Tax=Acer saccharum TaxID=4024 RepID=A0AA39W8D7_ACESA|nr:hypothetical protein LWI29_013635 [Acer saccharum]